MIVTYKILTIDTSGLAEVKYTHETLGSVIRRFYLPLNKDDFSIEQEIVYRFPRDHYRAMAMKKDERVQEKIKNYLNKEGTLEVEISDDGFYDTAVR